MYHRKKRHITEKKVRMENKEIKKSKETGGGGGGEIQHLLLCEIPRENRFLISVWRFGVAGFFGGFFVLLLSVTLLQQRLYL